MGLAASTLCFGVGQAGAELQMYKCLVGGRTVYQQAACSADAEPASAAATVAQTNPSAVAKAASGPTHATAAAEKRITQRGEPASSVHATPPEARARPER